MAKEGSVAPKERINIRYVPATGDQQEEVELPLKLLVLGDFKGKADDGLLEDRIPVSINKNNFEAVLRDMNVSKLITVPDKLRTEATEEDSIVIDLNFSSLADFTPDVITEKVPELARLKQIREALVLLKTPIGNIQSFRKSLQSLVTDKEKCEQILSELQNMSVKPGKE